MQGSAAQRSDTRIRHLSKCLFRVSLGFEGTAQHSNAEQRNATHRTAGQSKANRIQHFHSVVSCWFSSRAQCNATQGNAKQRKAKLIESGIGNSAFLSWLSNSPDKIIRCFIKQTRLQNEYSIRSRKNHRY